MNWEKEIRQVESSFGCHDKKSWRRVAELAKAFLLTNSNSVIMHVRMVYLLHNILVEEGCLNDERVLLEEALRECFEVSRRKFFENDEYLFFVGKILYIAEWYFGLNDDFKPLEDREAFRMQKKAFDAHPENLLYEWAYVLSRGDGKRAFILSSEIIYGEGDWLNWLKKWGFPGSYMVDCIECCYESYKGRETEPRNGI